MSADILTLFLAPLTVGVLLLYLQQIRESHRLRAEREAALAKLAETEKKITQDIDHYKDALRKARDYYDEQIKRKEDEVDWMHVSEELNRLMSSADYEPPEYLKYR